jgi:ActR/RegA family two-component response regulator
VAAFHTHHVCIACGLFALEKSVPLAISQLPVLTMREMMSDSTAYTESAKILLLEDDLLLAMDMEDYLLDRGHEVVGPFGRLVDALDAIPRNELAGAVVDLNLHGELSFPVIEELQARSVPIIVCTGYAELPEVKTRLKGLPLLPKPWTAHKLSSLMEETFGATQEPRDAPSSKIRN